MSESGMPATSVQLETLTPHHYQSLAIPSGVASLSTHMADRSVAYGLAGALGALSRSAALPVKNYRRDFACMTWFASVFEAENPRLLRPLGRRLNLDQEAGYRKSIQDATGTGNLKTWFFIQEIPPEVIYHGAVFGPDPFELASEAEGETVRHIVIRTGRHRGGLVRMAKSDERDVRLNLHTGFVCGADVAHDKRIGVEIPALWDLQISWSLTLSTASDIVTEWKTAAQKYSAPA